MRLRFLPVILLAASLAAHSSPEDFHTSGAAVSDIPAVGAAILAHGQGVAVTERDLWNEIEILPPERQRALADDSEAVKALVSEIYFRRRMVLLADEMGYSEEPIVQARLRRNQERLLMDLVPRLYMANLDLPDFAELAREEYEKNLERYTPESEIRVAHILLRAPSEEARAQRRPEAEALLVRLRSGESFAEIAREHGEDGTREFGGDLGFFSRGRMVPEFEEAAFALADIGDLDLVETRHGFHLILLVDRDGGVPTPFVEIESWIKDKLQREYQQEATVQWLRSVASPKDATVDEVVLDALVNELRLQQEGAELLPSVPESVFESRATELGASDLPPEAALAPEDAPAAQP